ncbi:MAG TPA: hypothetical protein VGS10_20860 [Terracidiphilus sp.]|nr:hypothetical protein [Terracidiphilus sp.]
MSLAEELLEHARFLANLDPRTTSQANIRRAVSAAYYAVFHMLSSDIAQQVSPGVPTGLRERTQRALEHGQMLRVAKAFSLPGAKRVKDLPDDLPLPEPISRELSSVASSFKELQEARYAADYDLLKQIDAADALILVQKAEIAFKDWQTERKSKNAPVFLACMMFGKIWNK